MDTGSALLMGPTEKVNSILAALGVEADCSNYDSLPSLTFEIDAVAGSSFFVVLEKQDYCERTVERYSYFLISNFKFF